MVLRLNAFTECSSGIRNVARVGFKTIFIGIQLHFISILHTCIFSFLLLRRTAFQMLSLRSFLIVTHNSCCISQHFKLKQVFLILFLFYSEPCGQFHRHTFTQIVFQFRIKMHYRRRRILECNTGITTKTVVDAN